MGSPERLFATYNPLRPSRFGPNYQPRPEVDVFGRRTASPLEVQRALEGTFDAENASSIISNGVSNREKRRMERAERIAAKKVRNGR